MAYIVWRCNPGGVAVQRSLFWQLRVVGSMLAALQCTNSMHKDERDRAAIARRLSCRRNAHHDAGFAPALHWKNICPSASADLLFVPDAALRLELMHSVQPAAGEDSLEVVDNKEAHLYKLNYNAMQGLHRVGARSKANRAKRARQSNNQARLIDAPYVNHHHHHHHLYLSAGQSESSVASSSTTNYHYHQHQRRLFSTVSGGDR